MSDAGGAVSPRRPAAALRPRDAATLVILDVSHGHPRILIGKRHAKQVFAPGKFVFPGGGFEPDDAKLALGGELPATDCARLAYDMKGTKSPARSRGLALTALRETFEETGILIGRPAAVDQSSAPASWTPYLAHGVVPDLTEMQFIARAITPPGRPRRYDTRFFCVSAELIFRQVELNDGEFTETLWVTFDEARGCELHSMTRTIIDDLADRLDGGLNPRRNAPVPYYRPVRGGFHRELIGGDEAG